MKEQEETNYLHIKEEDLDAYKNGFKAGIERVKALLPEMRLPPKGNNIPFDWGVEAEEDRMKRIGFNTALFEVKAILDSLINDSSKE